MNGNENIILHKEESAPSIMVVDDVLKNIQLMLTILSDEGYDIHFATSGVNALQSIQDKHIDLILLDIMMPEMDGYEVCRRLKANPVTSDIPVIFLTAKDAVEDKVKGFELGAVDYVSKPFQVREILARIHTHLELKKAREIIHTYNRQLEDLLEKRTRDLIVSERQAIFGQLVQGIVHNLKNPLSASMMSAQMINVAVDKFKNADHAAPDCKASEELLERILRAVKMIENSNNTLNDIITSMLTKSRQDKSETQKDIDLNHLIATEIAFMKSDLVFKNKVVKKVSLHPAPLLVHVVAGDISQVFQNLIRNALDAMFNQKDQKMEISTRCNDGFAELVVRDNGPGIPPEIQDRIFDPFFSTKPTTQNKNQSSDKPVGTGLGLWMCRESISAVNGTITVDSEPGKGTTFTVRIPMA